MIRKKIETVFLNVFEQEVEGQPTPQVSDDLILLESGLDSLGFAILVTELETELGFDAFSLSQDAYYPKTFGEFVSFYEKHKPE